MLKERKSLKNNLLVEFINIFDKQGLSVHRGSLVSRRAEVFTTLLYSKQLIEGHS
jgi:hypothetical protein